MEGGGGREREKGGGVKREGVIEKRRWVRGDRGGGVRLEQGEEREGGGKEGGGDRAERMSFK